MDRFRRTLPWLGVVGVVAFVVASAPILRRAPFHHYADQRTWLGIPHAGDVLSNLGFIITAIWIAGSRQATRVPRGFVWAACAGVGAIGLGSAAYHAWPSDLTLACDWGPIAITLSLVVAAVIADRVGPRAGLIAAVLGPLAASATVAYWCATGGTSGGDMAPYVAAQAAGVVLPPLIALSRPGQIATLELLVAVAGFVIARGFAARDAELLAMLGISGHSLKHVAAAGAAAIALRALCHRRTRS